MPHRRLLAWLLALLLLAAAPVQAGHKHFLWKVAGETNTVYLLGSIHALRPGDYPLAPVMRRAFRDADALILEIRLPPAGSGGAALALGSGDGPGLAAQLSAEQYRQAKELAGAQGIDLDSMSRLDPWLAALVIVQGALQRAGYDPGHGLDAHFQRLADAAGKPVLALETPQQQLRLFDELPADLQGAFLLRTLREARDVEATLEPLVSAWKAGRTDTVQRLVLDELRPFPELYERLIVHRNRNWLAQVEAFLEDRRDYLVVVGAAHLVGKQGLVAMLRRRGYTVIQQ
ncbi:MAG TPA: TraB/GumN family protein [Gammaproteobacteria bacterium]|nr:TraB/GumN family protein [Gammaproteobacteria bacterium]